MFKHNAEMLEANELMELGNTFLVLKSAIAIIIPIKSWQEAMKIFSSRGIMTPI